MTSKLSPTPIPQSSPVSSSPNRDGHLQVGSVYKTITYTTSCAQLTKFPTAGSYYPSDDQCCDDNQDNASNQGSETNRNQNYVSFCSSVVCRKEEEDIHASITLCIHLTLRFIVNILTIMAQCTCEKEIDVAIVHGSQSIVKLIICLPVGHNCFCWQL